MAFFRSGGLRIAVVAAATSIVAGALLGGGLYYYFTRDLPDLRSLDDYDPPVSSLVFDRNGKLIAEFAKQRRRLVPVEAIPEHVKQAFVAAEDGSFYEHGGVDYWAILRAALKNVLASEIKGGASTITQQMVKGLLLTPEQTYTRKLKEVILARRVEEAFTKDEILYLYLNTIYFGHGAYGIEQAARDYFGKSVSDLNVSEAALLAGLPQRPSDYSPYNKPEAAEARRRYALRRMLADEMIDQEQFDVAMASPPEIKEHEDNANFSPAANFTEEVRRYLYDHLGGDVVLEEGLRVETTLDIDLQKAAVEGVRKGLEDHDRRQGWRGPIRTVAADAIEAEIAKLAEENEERYARIEIEPEEDPKGTHETALAAVPDVSAPPEAEGVDVREGSEGEEELETIPPVPVRLEVPFDEPLVGVVTKIDKKAEIAQVAFGEGLFGEASIDDIHWAREVNPRVPPHDIQHVASILSVGDVANFVRLPDPEPKDKKNAKKVDPGQAPETTPRLDLAQLPLVEGALLSLENATGDVLAMVGGYDYTRSEFNRAVQARRQPGSAFKPFIYGAALLKGYTPVSTVVDRPVVYTDPITNFTWAPRNYGRRFYGPIPMRTALKKSINNATVHLFRDIGVDYVIDFARRLGIKAPLSHDLSLALGSSSVSLLELTTAYAVFPSGGKRVVPRFITRVTDAEGNVLLENVPLGAPGSSEDEATDSATAQENGEKSAKENVRLVSAREADGKDREQLISPQEAYLICDLLKAVVEEGTGRRLRSLGRPLAGKTGTTNDQADAWFMGFSPDFTTGVWVGYDSVRVLGWGETGARAALPIWGAFAQQALKRYPARDFEAPEGIVYERVDRETGLLADAQTKDAYFQPFIEGSEPKRSQTDQKTFLDARQAARDDIF